MQEAKVSRSRGSLLDYAISKLSPDVFSHPVWLRFGRDAESYSPDIIDNLLNTAKNISEDDPSTACQILLLCAVFLNRGGQYYKALQITQQARSLAEQTQRVKETLWTIWGACAISVQQGNYGPAAENLIDLQAVLSQQNEWILADFIDVLRQSFFKSGMEKHAAAFDTPLSGDLLNFTWDWLQHWGFSYQAFEPKFELAAGYPTTRASHQSAFTHSFFSIQHWQGRWHSLLLAIRGELRLQWMEHDQPSRERRYSFWGSFLSSLRVYFSGGRKGPQSPEETLEIPAISVTPSAQESTPATTATRKKQTAKTKRTRRVQSSAPAPTVRPVTVHMLGTFRMSIGDSVVKLPASRGLSILKYLVLHHKQNTPREVLMDVFWPQAEPEMARNNLNVAMHSLRKALRTFIFVPVIEFQEGTYCLERNLQVWLDVEEFERCVKAGQRLDARNQLTAAAAEYETAINIYQGDFLEQNSYEEWTILERERLRVAYLDTLDRLSQIYFSQERYASCITVCQFLLARDRCREDAHSLLMRCFSRQGQHHLARRQYQLCTEALRGELQVEPAPETTQLYNRIQRREQV